MHTNYDEKEDLRVIGNINPKLSGSLFAQGKSTYPF
jgi:hypothetical protein